MLDRIRAVAAAEPDSLAVQTPVGSLSYRQLLERADAISAWLAAHSGAAAAVALLTDKRPHAYSALLGALGAGSAFVPLDPDAPPQRTRALLRRAGCRVVVCGSEQIDVVGELAEHVLLVDEQPAPGHVRPADDVESATGRLVTAIRDLPPAGPADLPPGADSSELAYLILTSGSSGEPKGVQVERASLDTFATAIGELGQAGPGAR